MKTNATLARWHPAQVSFQPFILKHQSRRLRNRAQSPFREALIDSGFGGSKRGFVACAAFRDSIMGLAYSQWKFEEDEADSNTEDDRREAGGGSSDEIDDDGFRTRAPSSETASSSATWLYKNDVFGLDNQELGNLRSVNLDGAKLKVERLNHTQLVRLMTYVYSSMLVSFVLDLVIVGFAAGDTLFPTPSQEEQYARTPLSVSKAFFAIEGFLRTISSSMAFLLLLSFPQRCFFEAHRELKTVLPEQFLMACVILLPNVVPSLSIAGTFFYWFQYAGTVEYVEKYFQSDPNQGDVFSLSFFALNVSWADFLRKADAVLASFFVTMLLLEVGQLIHFFGLKSETTRVVTSSGRDDENVVGDAENNNINNDVGNGTPEREASMASSSSPSVRGSPSKKLLGSKQPSMREAIERMRSESRRVADPATSGDDDDDDDVVGDDVEQGRPDDANHNTSDDGDDENQRYDDERTKKRTGRADKIRDQVRGVLAQVLWHIFSQANYGFLGVLLFYFVSSITFNVALEMRTSLVPFVSMITVFRTCSAQIRCDVSETANTTCVQFNLFEYEGNSFCALDFQQGYPFARALAVVYLFLVECVIFVYLSKIRKVASKRLRHTKYDSHTRSKFLGFRFFDSNKSFTWFILLICSIFSCAIPNLTYWVLQADSSTSLLDSVDVESRTFSFKPLHTVGISYDVVGFGAVYIIFMTWLGILAYAYLPVSSYGFWGFWCPDPERTTTSFRDDYRHPRYLVLEKDVEQLRDETIRTTVKTSLVDSFLTRTVSRFARASSLISGSGAAASSSAAAASSSRRSSSFLVPENEIADQLKLDLRFPSSSDDVESGGDHPPTTSSAPFLLYPAESRPGASLIETQVTSNVIVLETMIQLWNFSRLAYEMVEYEKENADISEVYSSLDADVVLVKYVQRPDTNINATVCVVGDDRVVVTYRGTQGFRNLQTDINYRPTKFVQALSVVPLPSEKDIYSQSVANKAPEVHRGFLEAYNSVKSDVFDGIEEAVALLKRRHDDPDYRPPLLCCGHSLGGALATLLSFDAALRYTLGRRHTVSIHDPNNQHRPVLTNRVGNSSFEEYSEVVCNVNKISGVHLTTFGCPRVGNYSFASRHRMAVPSYHRWLIQADMVTKLPPNYTLLGYATKRGFVHSGIEIIMDDNGHVLLIPSMVEKTLFHGLKGYSLSKHMPNSYSLALTMWVARAHASYQPKWWLTTINLLLRNDKRGKEPVISAKNLREPLKSDFRRHLNVDGAKFTLNGVQLQNASAQTEASYFSR